VTEPINAHDDSEKGVDTRECVIWTVEVKRQHYIWHLLCCVCRATEPQSSSFSSAVQREQFAMHHGACIATWKKKDWPK
jgi:hypothetical protein